MIKFGKNTTPSEKYVKLMKQYNELKHKAAEKFAEIYHTDKDFVPAIRSQLKELEEQQAALEPVIYREFYRMFDKKYFILYNMCHEASCFYIDGVKIKKCKTIQANNWSAVFLNKASFKVNTDKCSYIQYDSLVGSYSVAKMGPFCRFMIFSNEYRITEITKKEFESKYKKAFSAEQVSQVRSAATCSLAFQYPSDELKKTKKYKDLANFLKTIKLRENLTKYEMEWLVLKDNKKSALAKAKDKEVRQLMTKAYDNLIANVEKKIEKKEKDIAKCSGVTE